MTDDEVTAFIEENPKFQLATINRDGTPHLVTMFSGLVEGKIAFWTYRKSRKAHNLARDPRVTCLIEAGTDYFELRGLMLYGTVRTLTEPNDVRYVGSQVVRRMMGLTDDDAIAAVVDQTVAKRHAYIVEPTGVASWDHRKLT
ncbi:pyridoxamine 5'-phosphate oxidase family protein [Actinoallomurus iriomotensis]|uniref:PPOX class F420-dependent enzyme n=1 Tax=Actinoallomurus iriomotensis TaxID=478107 RepID=A0A9W6VYP8_9ACTN|nr:pyridoxamine 5'-phosphate oxidase family protein [Actinoallomurus iriomotensis]GLY84534.1 PPOX class F420-dependent enzyme [Actinoallomurus iriomotensis]